MQELKKGEDEDLSPSPYQTIGPSVLDLHRTLSEAYLRFQSNKDRLNGYASQYRTPVEPI